MRAKLNLKFLDFFYDEDFITLKKGTHKTTGIDYIHIIIGTDGDSEGNKEIMIDRHTAIKLAKTLRTEINKLKSE